MAETLALGFRAPSVGLGSESLPTAPEQYWICVYQQGVLVVTLALFHQKGKGNAIKAS